MMDQVSRYLVLSDRAYADTTGVPVRLAYSTRTASTVAVDLPTARALEAGDAAALSPAWTGALRAAQLLVPAGEDELSAVLDRNRQASADRSAVHIALLPTSYCNMGCAYCGQEHTRGGLSRTHRSRVRDRVLRAVNAPETRSARIDWFGAEPMMGYAVIRDLAPRFVEAAAERGVAYSSVIVTNGSLLNPTKINTLIRSCGVTHFEITIDGPPDIHNEHRPLKSGRGSFWNIVRAVRAVLDEPDLGPTHFSFRTNVDVHNQDSVPRYVELMAELGFSHPRVSFSIAPVHSWGNDISAIEVSKHEFAERETGWLRLLSEHGLHTQLLPTTARKVLCPATTRSSEIISSTGNIFSCSEYPLVPEAENTLALTHIDRAGTEPVRPLGPFDGWNEEIAAGSTWCKSCVFMPTCGGSCPKAWQEGHPPCPGYKYNVQDRLDLIAAQCGLRDAAGEPAGAR
ncbi:radical SAM/SPASM domain-containing protein [Streptomyces sp. NPDC087866]|uniref:radical SAM/SPASM domain-containing protein n=1 Tax=unclassified Streptomyces TaxID=2593676 RepID=UPI0022508898|nr:radical SAM protein [Streptomyces sp. NBC_01789]MCX4446093.1 radical SAM protein [Streptomyces sp. NBC_01789]